MKTGIAAALAGGSLALGILIGAAGAVVVREATVPTMGMPAQMAAMHAMHQTMDGQMGGGMMDPSSGMQLHRQHHPDAK